MFELFFQSYYQMRIVNNFKKIINKECRYILEDANDTKNDCEGYENI